MPTDTGQFFDKLRTELQAGGGDIDVIGADVIWPAQFAATAGSRTSPTSSEE
jgi:multiple sugar transport system substrate-binding protein